MSITNFDGLLLVIRNVEVRSPEGTDVARQPTRLVFCAGVDNLLLQAKTGDVYTK